MYSVPGDQYRKVRVEFSGAFWVFIDLSALLLVASIYYADKKRIKFSYAASYYLIYGALALLAKSGLTSLAQSAIVQVNNSSSTKVGMSDNLISESFTRVGTYSLGLGLFIMALTLIPKRKKN